PAGRAAGRRAGARRAHAIRADARARSRSRAELTCGAASPAPRSLLDDRDRRREVVAQDGVHLVLDLIEADHLPSGQRLRELVEVRAPDPDAVALGGEPVARELHRLLVREVVEARGVVVEYLDATILDRGELALVAVVERPEARGLLVGERQV